MTTSKNFESPLKLKSPGFVPGDLVHVTNADELSLFYDWGKSAARPGPPKPHRNLLPRSDWNHHGNHRASWWKRMQGHGGRWSLEGGLGQHVLPEKDLKDAHCFDAPYGTRRHGSSPCVRQVFGRRGYRWFGVACDARGRGSQASMRQHFTLDTL